MVTKFNNSLVSAGAISGTRITGTSFSGPINPYITASNSNDDQPIVLYSVSGSPVPVPPGNLALVVPDSNNVRTIDTSNG